MIEEKTSHGNLPTPTSLRKNILNFGCHLQGNLKFNFMCKLAACFYQDLKRCSLLQEYKLFSLGINIFAINVFKDKSAEVDPCTEFILNRLDS